MMWLLEEKRRKEKGYVEMWKKMKDLMDKLSPWGCLFVSTCQFLQGFGIGGLGWLIAGVMMWLEDDAEKDLKKLTQLFREHLDSDSKKNEDGLIKENMFNPDLTNVDHMDIDHILEIGRDFQNSDKWHGATYDIAKLLCDTIENLRKNGERKHEVF